MLVRVFDLEENKNTVGFRARKHSDGRGVSRVSMWR